VYVCLLDTQEYDKSVVGEGSERQLSLPEHLCRPCRRVDDYITILQDLLRYTAKAGQHTGKLEQAIEMMMDLKKQADDLSTLDRITGYPGDPSLLGPIYRHVSRVSYYICTACSVKKTDTIRMVISMSNLNHLNRFSKFFH